MTEQAAIEELARTREQRARVAAALKMAIEAKRDQQLASEVVDAAIVALQREIESVMR